MTSRKTVLVVDDDELTRDFFTVLLEWQGCTVMNAGNGYEALERLRTGILPDCVVLDLNMPRFDGSLLRACLQREPNWADIPVVIVSGDPQIAEEAAFLQAEDYLAKPVEPEDLLRAIHLCD